MIYDMQKNKEYTTFGIAGGVHFIKGSGKKRDEIQMRKHQMKSRGANME